MKFNLSNNYSTHPATLLTLIALTNLLSQPCYATEPASNNGDETKHINIPFVHIDIKKHADGTKDVDVRAPFTNVHNPAGANNAQVKAPFYHSEHSTNDTNSTQTSTNSKTGINKTVSNKRVPAVQ